MIQKPCFEKKRLKGRKEVKVQRVITCYFCCLWNLWSSLFCPAKCRGLWRLREKLASKNRAAVFRRCQSWRCSNSVNTFPPLCYRPFGSWRNPLLSSGTWPRSWTWKCGGLRIEKALLLHANLFALLHQCKVDLISCKRFIGRVINYCCLINCSMSSCMQGWLISIDRWNASNVSHDSKRIRVTVSLQCNRSIDLDYNWHSVRVRFIPHARGNN